MGEHKGGINVDLHDVLPDLRILFAHWANIAEQSGIMQNTIQTWIINGNALCQLLAIFGRAGQQIENKPLWLTPSFFVYVAGYLM